nr:mucin-1-like [Paramormyrops kingsleyae]
MKITNSIYNQSLEDHNSDDYVKLSGDVRNLFQQIFGCLECATYQTYKGVADITFSNGSVITDSTLVFNTMFLINGDIIKNIFYDAIQTGSLNTSISVNPTYTNCKTSFVFCPFNMNLYLYQKLLD